MVNIESARHTCCGATGTLSDDPMCNYQYLFVCSATLASRFCIEGGMDSETYRNAHHASHWNDF